ncbi:hypothetical protein CUZ89_0798 [Enterococcus xinjiangensis]|nr:hypothetical protein [Enterococcus lactis]
MFKKTFFRYEAKFMQKCEKPFLFGCSYYLMQGSFFANF